MSSPTLLFFVFLLITILTGVRLWFWFTFPDDWSCACWPSAYLLWKNIYSDPLPTFKIRLFFCWTVLVIYIFWILDSYHIFIWLANSFSHLVVFLSFCIWPLDCADTFWFDVVSLVFFFFCLAFEVTSRKSLVKPMSRISLPVFF